jgi:hypothetical protein
VPESLRSAQIVVFVNSEAEKDGRVATQGAIGCLKALSSLVQRSCRVTVKFNVECGGFTQPAARNQFAASIMADFAGILPRIHVPPHVHIEVVLDVWGYSGHVLSQRDALGKWMEKNKNGGMQSHVESLSLAYAEGVAALDDVKQSFERAEHEDYLVAAALSWPWQFDPCHNPPDCHGLSRNDMGVAHIGIEHCRPWIIFTTGPFPSARQPASAQPRAWEEEDLTLLVGEPYSTDVAEEVPLEPARPTFDDDADQPFGVFDDGDDDEHNCEV